MLLQLLELLQLEQLVFGELVQVGRHGVGLGLSGGHQGRARSVKQVVLLAGNLSERQNVVPRLLFLLLGRRVRQIYNLAAANGFVCGEHFDGVWLRGGFLGKGLVLGGRTLGRVCGELHGDFFGEKQFFEEFKSVLLAVLLK